MEQLDEIQLKKERILAFKILRDLGASVLMEDHLRKVGDFQTLFLGEECLSKSGSYMETIVGTEQLKHHEVIRLVSKIQQTLEKGCYLEGGTSEFKKTGKKPIRNFNIKKQLLLSVLKYFYELYNVEKKEIEDYFQSMQRPSQTSNEERYQVILGDEVTEKDIDDAIELDFDGYEGENTYIGIKETCYKWYRRNPFIYFMIKDIHTQKIVGYINAMPVTDELYEALKQDELDDINIPHKGILRYTASGQYNLYFASIVVKPSLINHSKLARKLVDAVCDFFIEKANDNIIIKRMLAKEVSTDGKMLCLGMDMKSRNNDSIFEVSMYPPEFNGRKAAYRKLFDCYQKHYEEHKND